MTDLGNATTVIDPRSPYCRRVAAGDDGNLPHLDLDVVAGECTIVGSVTLPGDWCGGGVLFGSRIQSVQQPRVIVNIADGVPVYVPGTVEWTAGFQ